MPSAILRMQMKDTLGQALDEFERFVKLYEDQSGQKIPEEVLAATLAAGTRIQPSRSTSP